MSAYHGETSSVNLFEKHDLAAIGHPEAHGIRIEPDDCCWQRLGHAAQKVLVRTILNRGSPP